MASAKSQKPTNEEHKFSQKISEVTAWGSRVLGHKQQEHQAVGKHCTTCQCSQLRDTKPTHITATPKKEHAKTIPIKDMISNACTQTKKKKKEEQTSTVHKDAKHNSWVELRKKDKQPVGAEMKMKEKKEHRAKGNIFSNKEHKDEPASHYFSSMADHWKEKIMMVKKSKDGKSKDGGSSSDSDIEDESSGMRKTKNRHSQRTKIPSK